MSDIIDRAISMAYAAHRDQMYGGYPYTKHLNDVAGEIFQHFEKRLDFQIAMSAAFLHDTIEDTAVTHEALFQSFGEKVASIVEAVSKTAGQSFYSYLKQIRSGGELAVAVKVADRISNVRHCVFMMKNTPFKQGNAPSFSEKRLAQYMREHTEFVCRLYDWREKEIEPMWIDLCFLMNEVNGEGYFHPNDIILAVARASSAL